MDYEGLTVATSVQTMTTTAPAILLAEPRSTRVLLTGVGCPGAANMISALHSHGYHVVGTDVDPYASGRFLCDSFRTVLPGDHPNFANSVFPIIEEEGVDVVFPQIANELLAWSSLKPLLASINVPVLITGIRSFVEVCLDKAMTYTMAGSLDVPTLPWFSTGDGAVSKPTRGKGSRGVEITSVDEPSVVMGYVPGDETSVDALCANGQVLAHFCRERTWPRGGLHYMHEVIPDNIEVEYARVLVAHLHWDWFINIQFKGGYLMEVNPRISTQVVWGEFNLPALAVGLALGDVSPDDVKSIPPPPIGLRTQYFHFQITWQEEAQNE